MTENDLEMWSRVDERTTITLQRLDTFIERADRVYVTKAEFHPVRSVVFGLVTLIITAVFAAMVAMVLK